MSASSKCPETVDQDSVDPGISKPCLNLCKILGARDAYFFLVSYD